MVTTGGCQDVEVSSGADAPAADAEPSLDELVGLLFRLTGDLRQRFVDRSADFDLTFAQARAMRELDHPLPMGELAERLCCDASNVTGIVDRLEARGLVERRVGTDDRRVKHLVLTDAGWALRQVHCEAFAHDLPLLNDLSADERSMLVDLLRRAIGEGRTPLTSGSRDSHRGEGRRVLSAPAACATAPTSGADLRRR